MSRKDTKFPIISEAIEPTAAYIVGRMWARCEEAKAKGRDYHEGALMSFWWAVNALNSLSVAISTATHFSIAAMNHVHWAARMIEHEIGIDPMDEKANPMWKFR